MAFYETRAGFVHPVQGDIGEILADLATEGATRHPIAPFRSGAVRE